ncbi:hypothetical protein [Archangium sp.]|uniref:hypothetical protein n=1 Tax=Archangium sp. TaxID=1872627 RepID=UPI002D3FD767|nr:hypothetical protein [Archangium sp.]HYO53805.1 hypothetical protein [Archangium sp.]
MEDDRSIAFPEFFERAPIKVGAQGEPYELDGEMLRAVMIAANDFLPPNGHDRSCLEKQEAHRYRAIRQGNIIFVQISFNPAYCEYKYFILDGGVKYAISTDGRILRRLFDGEPEDLSPDAGEQEIRGTPVPDSQVGSTHWGKTDPNLPASWFDGGTRRPASESPPTVPDGGVQAPDGGSPGVPSMALPPDAG